MNGAHRRRVWKAAAVMTLLAASLVATVAARASVTTSLVNVQYAGDHFYNYDFDSKIVNAGNVDWPVDLIFWSNASVSKVQSKLGWIWPGSSEYALVDDGSGATWVSSGGRKNTFCTDTHYRLYAPAAGYLTNSVLGHYVIGTSHLDKNECGSSPQYGWNETSEANVAARAAAVYGSAAVVRNAVMLPDGTPTLGLLQNAQSGWEGSHYFDNNGYPTLVMVP
jgi:hypothetical protein